MHIINVYLRGGVIQYLSIPKECDVVVRSLITTVTVQILMTKEYPARWGFTKPARRQYESHRRRRVASRGSK